ncbi:DUF2188 domain-containing protein [Frateuria sp. GZRe12]|uniref:DUF2188 domain-containing protein n=1 Tax=Frateuria sp. GZRe12 TaxID=3351533 RepID=UPI003EDB749B
MPPHKRTTYHVLKTTQGWRLVREGGLRASAVASTKEAILRKARHLARRGGYEVLVHDERGLVTMRIATGRRIGTKSAKPVVASAAAKRVGAGEFVHDLLPPPTKPKKR